MRLTIEIVYNCRSTNAWDMDLALTATYFPHCGLTFAVLFGCPLSVEKEVLERLSFAMSETAHPLLMSGIFAEIERSRQLPIVESTIDELEARILELDFQASDMNIPEAEADRQRQQKRSAWLDTTYLRNALVSWNTQLAKILQHTDELNHVAFDSASLKDISTNEDIAVECNLVNTPVQSSMLGDVNPICRSSLLNTSLDNVVKYHSKVLDDGQPESIQELDGVIVSQGFCEQKDLDQNKRKLRRIGQKIQDRIQAIIDEYDDKIRDCTMRVEGMAMATQWARASRTFEQLGS